VESWSTSPSGGSNSACPPDPQVGRDAASEASERQTAVPRASSPTNLDSRAASGRRPPLGEDVRDAGRRQLLVGISEALARAVNGDSFGRSCLEAYRETFGSAPCCEDLRDERLHSTVSPILAAGPRPPVLGKEDRVTTRQVVLDFSARPVVRAAVEDCRPESTPTAPSHTSSNARARTARCPSAVRVWPTRQPPLLSAAS
jgi:hypothetical protein